MKKRTRIKLTLIILGFIIGLIIMLFGVQQIAFAPKVTSGFIQYTGRPICGSVPCSYNDDAFTYTTDTSFDIADSIFTTKTTVYNNCGVLGDSMLWRCCYKTDVFKNGVLLDTLTGDWVDANRNTPKIKTYDVNGQIYVGQKQNVTGLTVSTYENSWYSNNQCWSIQNSYEIQSSESAFVIDISSLKDSYIEGEDILINVKVVDNLVNTKGKLRIKYEVPTLIGNAVKTDELDVQLKQGVNNFNFTIPYSTPTTNLNITPELTVYYPIASTISGVNYNSQGVSGTDYIVFGTIKEPTKTVIITQKPIYITNTVYQNQTCDEIGCPTGYECYDKLCTKTELINCKTKGCSSGYICANNGVCEVKPDYSSLQKIVIYGVIVIIVLAITVYIFKKKLRNKTRHKY